jgi:hypothetical protein
MIRVQLRELKPRLAAGSGSGRRDATLTRRQGHQRQQDFVSIP